MRNPAGIILLTIAVAALLIAGCTQQQTVQPVPQPTAVPGMGATDTVRVMDTTLGKVLTDTKGMTLYYFITDIPGSGASTCYAAANCSHYWPIFSIDIIAVSPPLDPTDFSSITRTDGTKQTTYYGWPLYYFLNDKAPGDVKGENVLKTWYVAKPDYTVMIASSPKLGAFLSDPSGRTLYVFSPDTTGTSTCTGTCLAKWPAFYSDTLVAPSVLKTSDFGQIIRADGVKQLAYLGKPLYYFTGDTGPGQTTGQGFINKWNVANITGYVVPVPTIPPTTLPTPVPTIISYGSGGGGGY